MPEALADLFVRAAERDQLDHLSLPPVSENCVSPGFWSWPRRYFGACRAEPLADGSIR